MSLLIFFFSFRDCVEGICDVISLYVFGVSQVTANSTTVTRESFWYTFIASRCRTQTELINRYGRLVATKMLPKAERCSARACVHSTGDSRRHRTCDPLLEPNSQCLLHGNDHLQGESQKDSSEANSSWTKFPTSKLLWIPSCVERLT